MNVLLVYLSMFVCLAGSSTQTQRQRHRADVLNDQQLRQVAALSNTSHLEDILDNLLVPRVVSSKGHRKVRNYIVQQLKSLGWQVDLDSFQDETPVFGMLTFTNIIGTFNPTAKTFLVLACHYDSKYTRDGDFIGATDSAVPCAMMLNLAHQMRDLLATTELDMSLKLIFFDGEEAFKSWGPRDSLYGARHLAPLMENTYTMIDGERLNDIQRIDLMVLLDLLGAPDPRFYNYFSSTFKWYARLAETEERLARMGQLRQYSTGHPRQTYFSRRSLSAHVEDDHVPFLQRNVPILHVIPSPFPDVWHTPRDNKDAVDMHTVENLNKILRVFVAEYLHLPVPERRTPKRNVQRKREVHYLKPEALAQLAA